MIAVDAMGGDFAPKEVLKGVLRAAKKEIPILLCGPSQQLEEDLLAIDPKWNDYCITLLDATQVIEMGEEPIQACRKKKESSLIRAVASTKGKAKAVVSAGNSGALMAAAIFLLGRSDGI